MISKAIRSLLQVPDYYQDDLYLSTMVSFWCIIERLLDITKPLSICEIGSERGISSRKLASYCVNNNSRLSIVDPSGFKNIDSSDHVNLYQERSIDFFSRNIPIDFYLIDGDHNYQTVMTELESGLHNSNGKPPVYVLHDVSWPCAFRDYYYDYDSYKFKGVNPHKSNISIVIDSEDITEVGIPISPPYSAALKYGGDRNGVLRAVKDFKKKFEPNEWKFWKIPNLFGLGVLFHKVSMPENMIKEITLYLDSLDLFRPFLSILEANRLRILQSFFELQFYYTTSSQEHTEQKSRADELENQLAVSDEERIAQKSRADELENQLAVSDEERIAQKSRADELENQLAVSDEERIAQKSRADELIIHLKTSDEKNRNFELNLNIVKTHLAEIQENRWYRFGQLSRNRKLWVICRSIMKKIFWVGKKT